MDDDHVVVLEALGSAVQRVQQVLLTLKHARFAAEDPVLQAAFDARELQDGGEVW